MYGDGAPTTVVRRHEVVESCAGLDVPVPLEVEPGVACDLTVRGDLTDGVRDDVAIGEQSVGEGVLEEVPRLLRDITLVYHPSPGDVAGIVRLPGEQL